MGAWETTTSDIGADFIVPLQCPVRCLATRSLCAERSQEKSPDRFARHTPGVERARAGCLPGLREASNATTNKEAILSTGWLRPDPSVCFSAGENSVPPRGRFVDYVLDGRRGFVSGVWVANVIPMCECSVEVETMFAAEDRSLSRISFLAGQYM